MQDNDKFIAHKQGSLVFIDKFENSNKRIATSDKRESFSEYYSKNKTSRLNSKHSAVS